MATIALHREAATPATAQLGPDSQPLHDDGCDMDAANEVGGEAVVAGGELTAVLEPPEYALDGVAALVEGLAEATLLKARALRRDVWNGSLALDQAADPVGVVDAVGVDDAALGQVIQQVLRCATVCRLAGRRMESERSAISVGDVVGLGNAAAAAGADRLRVSPPPFRQRRSGVLSHACCR